MYLIYKYPNTGIPDCVVKVPAIAGSSIELYIYLSCRSLKLDIEFSQVMSNFS